VSAVPRCRIYRPSHEEKLPFQENPAERAWAVGVSFIVTNRKKSEKEGEKRFGRLLLQKVNGGGWAEMVIH